MKNDVTSKVPSPHQRINGKQCFLRGVLHCGRDLKWCQGAYLPTVCNTGLSILLGQVPESWLTCVNSPFSVIRLLWKGVGKLEKCCLVLMTYGIAFMSSLVNSLGIHKAHTWEDGSADIPDFSFCSYQDYILDSVLIWKACLCLS